MMEKGTAWKTVGMREEQPEGGEEKEKRDKIIIS